MRNRLFFVVFSGAKIQVFSLLSFLLLLLSIPAVFLLAPRLLLPRTLLAIPDADETEDLALFRRAEAWCRETAWLCCAA